MTVRKAEPFPSIATDMTALLPGGAATLANYTSFSKGINGLMIDVAGMPGAPTLAAFAFTTGNVDDTSTWMPLATPPTISVRQGAGVSGSDRVTLTWPDGAIKKEWLQVTMLTNSNTGLAANDVFYFGNAVGEAGNSAIDAQVNAADELAARANPRNLGNLALITFLYDYNRDRQVNAADRLIARGNPTNLATRLLLITPTPAALLDKPAVAPAAAALLEERAVVALVPNAAGEQPRGQAPRLADAALVAFGGDNDLLARRPRKR